MRKKYMHYTGELLTDAEYHGLGEPKNFTEVQMDVQLPFRIYYKMCADNWEKVTEKERFMLVEQLEDQKSRYSKNDYQYYMLNFQLDSLGAL